MRREALADAVEVLILLQEIEISTSRPPSTGRAAATRLGLEFLDEVRALYERIVEGPLQVPRPEVWNRRALLKRLSYAVYCAVEGDVIVVLHVARDPEERKKRRL